MRSRWLCVAATAMLVAGCGASAPEVLSPSTAALPSPTASPCPPLTSGSDALDDYYNMVVWQQRTYVLRESLADAEPKGAATLEKQIGAVSCNVYEWSARHGGRRVAPRPWPDGTATGLAEGTRLFALHGVRQECAIGAGTSQEASVFVAVDLNEPDPRPLCR